MTAEQFRKLIAFESSLQPGASVRVRWTNCGSHYQAAANVVRVNNKSVRVRLEEDVPTWSGGQGYRIGHEIVVPRLRDFLRWSCHNCVTPAAGFASD